MAFFAKKKSSIYLPPSRSLSGFMCFFIDFLALDEGGNTFNLNNSYNKIAEKADEKYLRFRDPML